MNGGEVVSLPWTPHYVENDAGGFVTFTFGDYDPQYPLVLQIGAPNFEAFEVSEPRNLEWSTYAGSNNTDEFMATDVDATGDVYVTGYTYQNNFPIGTGYQVYEPYQEALRGSEDVVTMKFQASNKQILWATYHGGNSAQTEPSNEWQGLDKGYDMVAYKGSDPELEYVYVTGATRSPDFPLKARESTIFEDADMTGYSGGLGEERAAFIIGYRQIDGRLDWSTLLGTQNSEFWEADGLGVDVDEYGTLIWAGRITRFVPGTFTYPLVTPTGAFTRSSGGGFLIHFNSAYQIIWNTFFGTQEYQSGVFDVKLADVGQQTKVFLTGTSGTGLDVYEPPGNAGFYQGTCGGMRDAYFSMFDLATYQLDYSTYWGGSAEEFGIALEVVDVAPHGGKNIWIGGVTKSTNLSSTQLPAPTYPGALHQTTLGGDADGMLLVFQTIPTVDLQYGTLYGGSGSDAVLDLGVSRGAENGYATTQIFAVGETSSAAQMDLVPNSSFFHQDVLGTVAGSTKRDGFLLGVNYYTKVPSWSTYYGGFHTDKCWGVSVSSDELFLVGGTNCDQTTFPLKEFDPTIPQDWYDGDLLNNVGSFASGDYSFNGQNWNNPFDAEVSQYEPHNGFAPDAFIASFGLSDAVVSVSEVPNASHILTARLISVDGLWLVDLPEGIRSMRTHDASGRIISEKRLPIGLRSQLVDLRNNSSGVYLLTFSSDAGTPYSSKVVKE